MELFRPVGAKEFALIEQSGFKRFPPRLPEQPIFYPVLNEKYATEIASRWNTTDSFSEYVGYVLRFNIDDTFIAKYDVQTAGASYHKEYWIPAEELDAFNDNITGNISVVKKFTSESK
jgi:hypothetical protein